MTNTVDTLFKEIIPILRESGLTGSVLIYLINGDSTCKYSMDIIINKDISIRYEEHKFFFHATKGYESYFMKKDLKQFNIEQTQEKIKEVFLNLFPLVDAPFDSPIYGKINLDNNTYSSNISLFELRAGIASLPND